MAAPNAMYSGEISTPTPDIHHFAYNGTNLIFKYGPKYTDLLDSNVGKANLVFTFEDLTGAKNTLNVSSVTVITSGGYPAYYQVTPSGSISFLVADTAYFMTAKTAANATGDPYVTTLSNIHYKLPAINAPVRFFQTIEDGKLLTINAQLKTISSADLDISNIQSLLVLKNKMNRKQYNNVMKKVLTPEDLSFFERVSIQYGDEKLVMNLWNSKFEVLGNSMKVKAQVVDRPELITNTGIYTGYKATTLQFNFGSTSLFLSVYNSPMIRNGISVETSAHKCNGVIVNTLKQADMVLPSLDSVAPVPTVDSAKAYTHAETFIDHDGLRTRNIVTYR